MIENVEIGINRYAPPGAEAINMYSMDGGSPLTLGQLMAAVCIRTGMNAEARGINKMNLMTSNNEVLDKASGYLDEIATNNATSGWDNIKNFLINTLKIESSTLPDNLDSYAKRNKAINAMKPKLEALTRQAQEDMIDLQSLVNRRDVSFSTGTNLIKSTGQSSMNIAQVL